VGQYADPMIQMDAREWRLFLSYGGGAMKQAPKIKQVFTHYSLETGRLIVGFFLYQTPVSTGGVECWQFLFGMVDLPPI
jgi:hypothetical protein